MKKNIAFARRLRKEMTDAERKLWKHLRSRRFEGYKFRRQHPIGRFIADFCCVERGLVIEVDGGQHAEDVNLQKDCERTAFLLQEGFHVLRFWDNDVLNKMDVVLGRIIDRIERTPSPRPSPSKEGEGVKNP
ncbi:MAG: hypothetical protein A3G34_15750 [Candidatus Lindowbacteria bacterium RIFCSPLOWO2_12_FULL_62_27]|nr:MAG: hypothetical protein A3I06_16700 [Candidatus Lindowbacteria bacterium RIFCSPLOWO2_02_FULL_62_12]OGH63303.1 MAG: hypothetical protein A3G34_15750 [Candidatus Lindowbacteria bacterium RIFCSPLOWO2_12_FULL_62_27]